MHKTSGLLLLMVSLKNSKIHPRRPRKPKKLLLNLLGAVRKAERRNLLLRAMINNFFRNSISEIVFLIEDFSITAIYAAKS